MAVISIQSKTSSTGGGGSSGPLRLTFAGNSGTVGQAFQGSLVAVGGTQPYTYAITTGLAALTAAGLTLTANTGQITGTPTVSGSYSFTGKVTDASATVVTLTTCVISITSPSSVTAAPAVTATVVVDYQSWLNVVVPNFSGVITLPTTDPNYSALLSVWIYAVAPTTGTRYLLASYPKPSSGTTITYTDLWNQNIVVGASPQSGWTLAFVTENASGNPTEFDSSTFTIAAQGNLPAITNITSLAEIGSRYQNPPGGNTYTQISATINWTESQVSIPTYTVWRGFNNGSSISWQWVGWQQGKLGTTSTINDSFFIPLGSNTYLVAAVAGTYPTTQTSPPSYAISSGAITMVIGAPSGTAPSITATNTVGAAITSSNIYMGTNANNLPWAAVLLALQSATTDTNSYFYDVYCVWTDSSGTLLTAGNIGGFNNTPGYQHIATVANDGKLWIKELDINYPTNPNAYLTIQAWARTRNSPSSGVPPFTGDSNSTLVIFPSGSGFYRIPVGAAPSTGLTLTLSNNLAFVNKPFAASVQAIAGVAPYTYSCPSTYLTNPNPLPAGLSFTAATGQISGTPTAVGVTNTNVLVTDSTGVTTAVSFGFTVTNGPMIVGFPGTQAMIGNAYSKTASAIGGIGPYTWAITTGGTTLTAAGFTLNATTGVLSAASVTGSAQTITFTIQATDSIGETAAQTFSINVVGGGLSLTASVPIAVVGQPYTASLNPVNGLAPYSTTITGTLPTGLSASNGKITGTPTTVGRYVGFTGTVTDATGATATATFNIIVTSGTLAGSFNGLGATVASPYSSQVIVNGGLPVYSFAVQSGTTKPSWLTLDSNGLLSGTPTTTGSVSFGVTVTDSIASTVNVSVSFSVGNTTSLPPNVLGTTTATISYQSYGNAIVPVFSGTIALPTAASNYAQLATIELYAVSPSNQEYFLGSYSTWSGTSFAYTGWNPAILQTGSPQTGWAIQFVCLNAAGISAPSSFEVTGLTIAAQGNNPAITNVAIAEVGSRAQIPAGGNTYTTVSVGLTYAASQATIPTFTLWQSFNGGTTKSWVGWYQGSTGTSSTIDLNFFIPLGTNSFIVYALPGTYGQNITSPPTIVAGNTSNTLTLSIGTASTSASILGITNSQGVAPTQTNIYQGINGIGNPWAEVILSMQTPGSSDTASFYYDWWCAFTDVSGTLITNPGGVATTGGWSHIGQPANTGQPWQEPLDINYPTGDYYLTFSVWAVTRNDTASSSWTPATGAVAGRTLCTWPVGLGGNTFYRLHVGAPPTSALNLTASVSGMTGLAGQPFSGLLSATGGAGVYTWSITIGTLPTGLSLTGSTITGTPTGPGTTALTAQVTDQSGNHSTVNFTIVISGGALLVQFTSVTGTIGQAYRATVHTVGGVGVYSYTLNSGTLPTGLTLNSDGTITGTPTVVGNFSFTVQARDSAGNTQNSVAFNIFINGLGLVLTFAASGPAVVNQAYTAQLTATGGRPGSPTAYTYALTIGSLPAGLSGPDATGKISGTPTGSTGNYIFTITATDGASNVATCACTITLITSATLTPASVTSPSSCTVGYQFAGNAVVANFSGFVTLPSIVTSLTTINVYVVVSGTAYQIASYTPSSFTSGATFTFSGFNNAVMLTSSSQTVSIEFVCLNSNGLAGLVNFNITGVTVSALGNIPAISSCSIATSGGQYQQFNGGPSSVYQNIGITTTFAATQAVPGQWTIWETFNNGSTFQWVGWYPIGNASSGTATINAIVPTGLTNTYFVKVAPGTYSSSVAPPSFAISSNSINLAITPALSTSATCYVTAPPGPSGATPTQANIFMGINPVGAPYAEVFVNIQTAGAASSSTYSYDVWCVWTDASGNLIPNPNGPANNPGWSHMAQPKNDGSLWSQNLLINYPSIANCFLTFQIWACTLSATQGTPPFSTDVSNGFRTLCKFTNGNTFWRVPVLTPPGPPNNAWNQGTSQNTNIGSSILTDPSFEYSGAGIVGQNISGVTTFGPGYLNPMWQATINTNNTISILNDGGNSGANYCRLVGANAAVVQTVSVQPGLPIYTQCYVRNNGSDSCALYWFFFDKTGAPISGSFTVQSLNGTFASFTQMAGIMTAPSNAASGTIIFQISSAGSIHWDLDDVFVQQVVSQVSSGQNANMNLVGNSNAPAGIQIKNTTTADVGFYGQSWCEMNTANQQVAASTTSGASALVLWANLGLSTTTGWWFQSFTNGTTTLTIYNGGTAHTGQSTTINIGGVNHQFLNGILVS